VKLDTPGWWRARCRVELDKLRAAPRRLRKEARQDAAPGYRARIWWKVVRRVLGPEWVSMPDRRQLHLF
jgi:hypothetical protein